MIHILYGNDVEKKREAVATLSRIENILRIPRERMSREFLLSYAESQSLFGEKEILVLENPLSESDVVFDGELLGALESSSSIFIFLEDALTKSEATRYKKYTESITEYSKKETVVKKSDPFAVANAFGKKDKILAWTTYMNLVSRGESPEAISGMLFWKIKSMLVSGNTKLFSVDQLKKASGELVDLYHKGHSGEEDMTVGLEQFILKTLS